MMDKVNCLPTAVFLDRDGTIGGGNEVVYPGEFQLFPQVKESIQLLQKHQIKVFAFTNQPSVSQGLATTEAFQTELRSFGFNDVYLCPHQHGEGCNCRKPAIGMLQQAAKQYQLNLNQCVVIGDRWTDMVAAHAAGCTKILVQTGTGVDAMVRYRHKWANIEPDYVAKDVVDAVHWIVTEV